MGKTAIGGILAKRLGRSLLDNDATLRDRTGDVAANLAETVGLQVLHDLESAALRADLAHDEPAVITAAASTITDPACRRLLTARAVVVWLDADPAVSAERMRSGTHRPDLTDGNGTDPEEQVRRLRDERGPLFRSIADLVVDTSTRSPAEVVDLIFGADT